MLGLFRMPRWPTPPLVAALQGIRNELRQLKEQQMADFTSLNSRIDALTASLDAAKARIAEDFQALRDQLANDSDDQAAVDAAVAKLDTSISALDSVDPDPNSPAAPVE